MIAPFFSVVLITKDEERSLPNLFKTLEDFKSRGGKTIVVDTGSTDRTVEIAKEWGCRVEEVGDRFRYTIDEATAKKINETFVSEGEEPIVKAGDTYFGFGSSRAYAMSLSETDWVICPGADERLEKFDIDALGKLKDEGNTQVRFDYVWSRNADGQPAVRFFRDAYLFDRTKWHWTGEIHETTVENTPGEKWCNAPEPVTLVQHYQIGQASRTNRDLVGLAVSLLADPTNDRHAHYFARELMFKKRYMSSLDMFMKHASNTAAWDLERGQSITFIGDCYQQLGKIDMAIQQYLRSFMYCAARREPLIRIAEIFYRQKDAQRCACFANAALAVPYVQFYANQLSHYRELPHEMLYWALWHLGKRQAAASHWRECIQYCPTNQRYIDDARFFQEDELHA